MTGHVPRESAKPSARTSGSRRQSSSPQHSDKTHCAALGCRAPAPRDRPFCRSHWRKLSKHLRTLFCRSDWRKLPRDRRTATLRPAVVYLGERDKYVVERLTSTVRTAAAVARDAWLYGDRIGDDDRKNLGTPHTWHRVERGFEALVPKAEAEAIIRVLRDDWNTDPAQIGPALKVLRRIMFTNARHRAMVAGDKRAVGAAADRHYPERERKEEPGALTPFLKRLDAVLAELEQLAAYRLETPVTLQKRNAALQLTDQTVREDRLKESIIGTLTYARQVLVRLRERLPRRHAGRKVSLVTPHGKPARRRDLHRAVRDVIRPLHPRGTLSPCPPAVDADIMRLARRIVDAARVIGTRPRASS